MDDKKACRNAKSSLTRRCNNLISIIQNDRPVEEVIESLELVEIDYKTVKAKHEAFVEKIDDEEFHKEEAWIEDCRNKTLNLRFRAKDYILSKQAQITRENNGESDISVVKDEQLNENQTDNVAQDTGQPDEIEQSVQDISEASPQPVAEKTQDTPTSIETGKDNPLARREAFAAGRRPEGANIDRRLVPYHGKCRRIQSRIEFIY